MLARIRDRFRRTVIEFARERRGSVLPIVAICITSLIIAIGLAVDGSRLVVMQSKLQSAVDAAGLSAAARYSTHDVSAETEQFAEANFLGAGIGAVINTVVTKPSADEEVLMIEATASAPATFMKLLGFETISTTAKTEVTRAGKGGIELSLVLDVTGSMNMDNKLGSLKTASNNLLDILFKDNPTDDLLHIGIVPFSESVNIGTSRAGWMSRTGKSWLGCVEARFEGYDLKDDPPSNSNKVTLFDPADKVGLYCPPVVTPLTSTKATLKSAIGKLTAAGNTHIAMGASWGWHMLSPKWQGRWGGTMGSTLPLASGTKGMTKAMVIMTDGDNTWGTDTSYGPYTCPTYDRLGRCTSYATDSRLGAKGNSSDEFLRSAQVALDNKLTAVCTRIKNAGITVYTVSLGSVAEETAARLQACASQSSYYFASSNGAALKTAFAKIGDSLSQLRISR